MRKTIGISCIVLAVFLSFLTLISSHPENDEQIYITLAKRIACRATNCLVFDFSHYNLLGSKILTVLAEPEYKQKTFFHPPVGIMLLSLGYQTGGEIGVRAVPLFLWIVLIVFVYKVTGLFQLSKETRLYSLVLLFCSPLLMFNAQKIWLDLCMATMIIISFYYLLLGLQYKKMISFFFSGTFFLCAVYTKYWAFVLFIPFAALLIYKQSKKFFYPLLLLVAPLVLFVVANSIFKFFPVGSHPLLQVLFRARPSIESPYPFIQYVTHRPFFYYVFALLATNPSLLYLLILLRKKMQERTQHRLQSDISVFLPLFVGYHIIVFSLLTVLGSGFQTRYIIFLEPFLILYIVLLIERDGRKKYPLLFLCILHNIVLVAANTHIFHTAELFPFIELFFAY